METIEQKINEFLIWNAKRVANSDENSEEFLQAVSKQKEEFINGIDCGDNEDLFLAIAALRDDSDYMQWFTSHEPEPNDRSMFLCKSENVKDYIHNYMDGWDTEGMTKATVEELVEHFKEKE